LATHKAALAMMQYTCSYLSTSHHIGSGFNPSPFPVSFKVNAVALAILRILQFPPSL